MAQKVQVLLTDDIDGSDAEHTVKFGWLGADYEIDVNAKNFAAFEKAITKYIENGRKISGGAKASKGQPKRKPEVDLNEVRAWATANGYEVSNRGRIAGAILEAFHAAGH